MAKSRGKQRGISGDTPKKLIAVAVDLFSRKGFKGTSIRDIAAVMGMTTSNIYHYFGTKRGLLLAIEQATLEPIMQEFRRISNLDMPPLDRFTLLIKTHLSHMNAYRKESKIFSLKEDTSTSGSKDLNKRFQSETFNIYRSEIERLQASMGKKGNSTIAAFNTLGAVIWFLQWYNPDGSCSLDEVVDTIIDYVLYGVIGDRPRK